MAVDTRRDSPTFGRWVGVALSRENRRSLYSSGPGCIHGFCVVSSEAEVIYKTTEEYAPELEWGVRWDDSFLGIPWPVSSPRLSARDSRWPALEDVVCAGYI